MSWTEEKVQKLKDLWGKDKTASQIAEIIGGISRNAVIGKAHRLNLSAKIKTRNSSQNYGVNKGWQKIPSHKKIRKSKFKSLLLDNNFEPAKNLNLEELTDKTCKYMEGHPDDSSSSFLSQFPSIANTLQLQIPFNCQFTSIANSIQLLIQFNCQFI